MTIVNNSSIRTSSNSSTQNILEGKQLMTFIFLALLIFFTTFGNIIVCLAILRTRRLRTCSNILIIHMALGDIFYSISTLPLSMVLLCYRSNWPLGQLGNIIFDATWFAFVMLSFINVVVIAIERYIAITQPFRYNTCVTKRCVINVCIACWAYVVIVTVALTFIYRKPKVHVYYFLIPPEAYYVIVIFHATLAFVLVPWAYTKIYSIARRHKMEIKKHSDTKNRRVFHREMKATLTIGLVTCLFFLVWLPFLVNQFVDFTQIKQGIWDANNSIMCYITYCNGPVNILVYSCWNGEIRKAISTVMCISKIQSRVSSLSNTNHSVENQQSSI